MTLEGLAIPLVVRNSTQVTFCYDGKTHWVTDDLNLPIVTLPGSYQVALGCRSVWDPSCMRSWPHDPDRDIMHGFSTRTSPAGTYECRIAMNGAWGENYGEGGEWDGANIIFDVTKGGSLVTFTYDSSSHVLHIGEDLRAVESASTSCQSPQDCIDRVGIVAAAVTHYVLKTYVLAP